MTESICETDEFGNERWILNGKYHRENGPAFRHFNGTKEWRLYGNLHRESGPAVEWADGTKEWYLNGALHREDGPAIERPSGYKSWWLNGKLHREGGPAIEFNDMTSWYLDSEFIVNGTRPENWDELVTLYQIERVMND